MAAASSSEVGTGDEALNKREFIDTLHKEQTEWMALVAEVGDSRMTLPGAAGDWCMKDVVAHVSAYEKWLVDLFAAVKRGALPAPSVLNDPDLDRRNAIVYEANKDRSLAEVLAESRQVFAQLAAALEVLPDEEFINEKGTAWYIEPFWKEPIPLWEAVEGDTYGHYHEHIPSIRAWLEALR
jgi:hypothetical protein